MAAVIDLMLLNLSLRLAIVVANPQVQKDYSKCMSGGPTGNFDSLFPSWFSIPCVQCVCLTENGQERCFARRVPCPQLKCSIYESKTSNCCRVCKGCYYNNVSYKDGEKWHASSDPCIRYICKEGIISRYFERCYEKHRNSSMALVKLPTNNCCISRRDLLPVWNTTKNSSEFESETPLKNDPCTLCRIIKNGSLICRTKICPVLACPLQRRRDPTQCCQKCDETKLMSRFLREQKCLVNGVEIEHGGWYRINSCKICQCHNATAICNITTCPKLKCKNENLVYSGSRCCPVCRDISSCIHMRKRYSNGEVWFLKGCVECHCKNGRNFCKRQKCLTNRTGCPDGQTLDYQIGSCCRSCIEKRYSCITFGDPHYQTFDGKFYSYQGTCKYLFTKDANNTFSVQVKNSARFTGRFSWTKSVQLKFGSYIVNLQQNLKVRLNGKRIRTPFLDYPTLDIREMKRYISIYTSIGLSLIWDGDSYLVVSISKRYQNMLKGLCGNYNGDANDDLNLLNGRPGHPVTFAEQWIMGKEKQCRKRLKPAHLSLSRCRGWKLYYAHKTCSAFKNREAEKCFSTVNPAMYYQSCVFDVCECPMNSRCECSAIKAYSTKCKRQMRKAFKWNSEELCNIKCTGGSRYSSCGPACKHTCSDYSKRRLCLKPCIPGCHCNAGFIWHGGRCILPTQCPQ